MLEWAEVGSPLQHRLPEPALVQVWLLRTCWPQSLYPVQHLQHLPRIGPRSAQGGWAQCLDQLCCCLQLLHLAAQIVMGVDCSQDGYPHHCHPLDHAPHDFLDFVWTPVLLLQEDLQPVWDLLQEMGCSERQRSPGVCCYCCCLDLQWHPLPNCCSVRQQLMKGLPHRAAIWQWAQS